MFTNFPVKFGDYTLLELIARGGMAEVYRATKAGIGGFEKPVAIKMILPHLAQNEEFIAMLTDEARLIVSISHTNVAQVYDFCFSEGRYFIAMEYVHGIDVAGLYNRVKQFGELIPIEHSTYIAECVCAGLYYTHTKVDKDGKRLNIVHRDISPQNVLLSYAGEVKIIDFGIAKARNRDGSTQAGVVKGKLQYMAPEQARGEAIDGRADIFAAGIVFYELLTGRLPFDGENEFEIFNNLTKGQITSPTLLNPAVTPELERIVLKMLERDIDKRYANGDLVKQDLDRELQRLSPGYTNTRLSKFIEELLERENADKQVTEGSKPKPASDFKGRTQKNSLPPGIIENQESEPQPDEPPKTTTSQEVYSFAPVIDPENPEPPHVQPYDFEVSESRDVAPPKSSGLHSFPLLIAFSFIGFAVIAGVSIATFYLLSPEPSPTSTHLANADDVFQTPLLDSPQDSDSHLNENEKHSVVTSEVTQTDHTLKIFFDTEPQGASVKEDGNFVGITPFLMYTDKTDLTKKFTFSMEDFNDVSIAVVLGSDVSKVLKLQPKNSKGRARKKRLSHRKKSRQEKSDSGLINPFGL